MHITLQGVRLKVEPSTTEEANRAETGADFSGNDMALVYRWTCQPPKGVPKAVDTEKKVRLPNLLLFSESAFLGSQTDHNDYASDLMKRRLVAATGKSYGDCARAVQQALKSVPFDVPMDKYDRLKPFAGFDLLAFVYCDIVSASNATLDIRAFIAIPAAVQFRPRIRHYCNLDAYGELVDGDTSLLRPTEYVEGYSTTKAGRQMRLLTLKERLKERERDLEKATEAKEKTRLREIIRILQARIRHIVETDGAGD